MDPRRNNKYWYDALSIEQKQILCEYNLSKNEIALKEKKALFKELAEKYEDGSEETPRDLGLARKYKRQYEKLAGIAVDQPSFFTKLFSKTFTTKVLIYDLFWYLNDLRLKLVYSNSALGIIGKSFLPRIFGIFGIGYAIRLGIDLSICTYAAFRPLKKVHMSDLFLMTIDDIENINKNILKEAQEKRRPILIKTGRKFFLYGNPKNDGQWTFTEIETTDFDLNKLPFADGIIKKYSHQRFTPPLLAALKKGNDFLRTPSHWQRFKNELLAGDRPGRMLNDIVWAPVNFFGYLFGGTIAIALNLAAFCWDLINTVIRPFTKDNTSAKLLREINKQLANPDCSPADKIKFEYYKSKTEKKILNDRASSLYAVIATTFTILGAAMTLFPPTLFPGIFILGTGTVMILAPAIKKKCFSLINAVGSLVNFIKRKRHKVTDEHEPLQLKEIGNEHHLAPAENYPKPEVKAMPEVKPVTKQTTNEVVFDKIPPIPDPKPIFSPQIAFPTDTNKELVEEHISPSIAAQNDRNINSLEEEKLTSPANTKTNTSINPSTISINAKLEEVKKTERYQCMQTLVGKCTSIPQLDLNKKVNESPKVSNVSIFNPQYQTFSAPKTVEMDITNSQPIPAGAGVKF